MLTLDQLESSNIEDKRQLSSLWVEARLYLEAQPWCNEIEALLFSDGFEHVGVFYGYVKSASNVSNEVWVIVGDLPPMHIETNGGAVTTPAEALFLYASRLIAWYEAAREDPTMPNGPTLARRHSLERVEASPRFVDLIDRRIELLMGSVIPWMLGEPGTLSKTRPPRSSS